MVRIAVGGFGHETNSFVGEKASFAYFCTHRDRPPLVRGPQIFEWLREGSFPISSFMREMEDHTLLPLVWAHGSAGGPVTDEAFERVVGELIGRLSQVLPVDGVYLDLHGAMVTETFEDAEGEILRRVRAAVGDTPVVASIDYHANVSPEMVEYADALPAFRTYPHVDRPETGCRAALAMTELLRRGRPTGRAFRKIPFLIPIIDQCTLTEPSKGIAALAEAESEGLLNLAYAAGFPLSDLYWCGPSVSVHAYDQRAAEEAVEKVAGAVEKREPEFHAPLLSPAAAVQKALSVAAKAKRPVIIADVQDNPGAGGSGDTTGVLQELIRARASDTLVGIFYDPEAACKAHNAGVGSVVELALGAKRRSVPDGPVVGAFTVERLASGPFRTTGGVAGGIKVDLGRMALLKTDGVEILVSSRRMQAMDSEPFRRLGVDPAKKRIVVLKSAVHFRAEFQSIAEMIVLAAAPGDCPNDPEEYPYKRLRSGVRLKPMGAEFPGSKRAGHGKRSVTGSIATS